jgi:hypothetical protein
MAGRRPQGDYLPTVDQLREALRSHDYSHPTYQNRKSTREATCVFPESKHPESKLAKPDPAYDPAYTLVHGWGRSLGLSPDVWGDGAESGRQPGRDSSRPTSGSSGSVGPPVSWRAPGAGVGAMPRGRRNVGRWWHRPGRGKSRYGVADASNISSYVLSYVALKRWLLLDI